MVFLTNKPVDSFLPKDGLLCEISAISYKDVPSRDFPTSLILDLVPNYGLRGVQSVTSRRSVRTVNAPVELHPGNIIYVFQDNCQNALEIRVVNHDSLRR